MLEKPFWREKWKSKPRAFLSCKQRVSVYLMYWVSCQLWEGFVQVIAAGAHQLGMRLSLYLCNSGDWRQYELSPGPAPGALSRFKVTPVCVWSGRTDRETERADIWQRFSGHLTLDYVERISHKGGVTRLTIEMTLSGSVGGSPVSKISHLM